MAPSSCAMEVQGAGLAGRLLPTRHRRIVSSGYHLPRGNMFHWDSMPGMAWRMRTRGTQTTLKPAKAVGNNSRAELWTTDGPPVLAAAADMFVNEEEEEASRRMIVTPEKLDHWMRESIGEIVRNIGEAPFLMDIFSDDGGLGGSEGACSGLRLEKEAAASTESWMGIKKRWDEERRTPDAVILVEELGGDDDVVRRMASTTWGLVVQGRGMDCAACYILNTTRVKSSMGFCTHFCLVRAKCFGEAADVQLTNAWLQGR
ncbi:hypothetical protein Cni_G20531 [Canna indica]|uniref:DUF7804 domain-containing protein n=1 Tax=Canna indica TaxID=4628 RepID=A0AAQ3KQ47_9LILI|nr:hypothetical protein Cni_G20531 [Canna indica]